MIQISDDLLERLNASSGKFFNWAHGCTPLQDTAQTLTFSFDYLPDAALKDMAQNEQKSVEELAASLIEQQITPEYDESRDPLLLIAHAAEEAGLRSGQNDVVERSREILNTEFPDYLMKRLHEQDNNAE